MSALRQRQRIVKVRKIQHALAANAAAAAAGRVRSLELSRERLLQMRAELRPVEGQTTGQALAQLGELAMRLDNARLGLAPTIESARSAAATREAERLTARRDQESAEKLEDMAFRAAEELAEQKLRGVFRRRARIQTGD
ncbi:MAG TPA: hypothetical protein VMG08_04150 [Allosphingosinicella sp.]|nr:hypothetical protein [Allosphingosinicella sp.]